MYKRGSSLFHGIRISELICTRRSASYADTRQILDLQRAERLKLAQEIQNANNC